MNKSNPWLQYLCAFLLGSIAPLAFAPYSLWPVIFVSLTVFLFLIDGRSAKMGAKLGFSYAMGMYAFGITWIHVSMDLFGGMPAVATWALMALLCAYLAIFTLLTGYVAQRFKVSLKWQYWLLMPVTWLIFDWLRGHFMTGFPWLWLGYSQIDSPLAGFAPIFGVQGITLAILLICGSLVIAIKSKTWLWPASLIAALFAVGGYLNNQTFTQPLPVAKVALVQGNIDQNLKWQDEQLWPSLKLYYELSQIQEPLDLIIWPESAIAALELNVEPYLVRLNQDMNDRGTSLITGIIEYRKAEKTYYNTLIALGDTPLEHDYEPNHINRYAKHHLLPIGEFVPFEDWLRPLAPYFDLPMSSFNRGDYVQSNLLTKKNKIAPAICYEIAYSEQLRQNILDDTSMILTVSNDAWFGDSNGPHQHLEIAQMRALEFGRPVLRATNTGITAFIDHHGNITSRADQFKTQVITQDVVPMTGQTPYGRIGSWPLIVWVCSIFSLCIWRHFRVEQKISG
ncbi:apolipoprotein N-acyltransferase [Motilimonas cestriensis]|uniref:Apolipoprotein N-acyltransferase n=1 Tax=Motilimonas cestriensis TaxID=2742685 RepID=A0ABS8W659_9GAMM|nr:apolipoprotein N-acyltransferase [Motilimonas cestriensis]